MIYHFKNEDWKPVKGYDRIYEVSNYGNIRKCGSSSLMKIRIGSKGYPSINLSKSGKSKTLRVHRLVAEAFITRSPEMNQVNHIDGNKLNNHVNNLEWSNAKENVNHAFKNDLIETSNKVILENKETNELIPFISMAEASIYLGRGINYISEKCKNGIFEIDNFNIYVMYRNKKFEV